MTDRHSIKPYTLRLPDDLRSKLEEAASLGNRTLHSEVLARLERSFDEVQGVGGIGSSDLLKRMEALEAMVSAVVGQKPAKKARA